MTAIIHQPPAVFFCSAGGIDVTNTMNKYLIQLSVKGEFGGVFASADLVFDDTGGQLQIPPDGTTVTIGLGWQDTGPMAVFSGSQVYTKSKGSRSHGRTLTLSLTSGNLSASGGVKGQADQHADNMTFAEAAKKFAPPGFNAQILGALGDINRPYWSMNNQSFPEWFNKMAKELGGSTLANPTSFVMTPVGSNQTGVILQADCAQGGNVLDWDLIPNYGRFQYGKYQTLTYDAAAAVLNNDTGVLQSGQPTATNKSKAPTSDQAQTQSTADQNFGQNSLKGGTLILVGEPSAVPGAEVNLTNARDGVDGLWHIDVVEHTYSRSGGFETHLELSNPT